MRSVAFALAIAFAAVCACGSNPRNMLVVPYDAGTDAAGDAGADAPGDAPPDADPYLGGPCVDDAQCDDGIACTYDSCDEALGRCRNVPDDTQCQDGLYCTCRLRARYHRTAARYSSSASGSYRTGFTCLR
jgi:hypothetical protein